MVYYDKSLYIMGGKINDIVTKNCQRYDFREKEWLDVQKMSEGRIHFGLVTINELGIIAIGGYNGESAV